MKQNVGPDSQQTAIAETKAVSAVTPNSLQCSTLQVPR